MRAKTKNEIEATGGLTKLGSDQSALQPINQDERGNQVATALPYTDISASVPLADIKTRCAIATAMMKVGRSIWDEGIAQWPMRFAFVAPGEQVDSETGEVSIIERVHFVDDKGNVATTGSRSVAQTIKRLIDTGAFGRYLEPPIIIHFNRERRPGRREFLTMSINETDLERLFSGDLAPGK